MSERLILNDAKDPLGRKVVRAELGLDGYVMLDLPKRYAQTGASRFSEGPSVRYLDKENCLYLRAWLDEVLPEVEDGG